MISQSLKGRLFLTITVPFTLSLLLLLPPGKPKARSAMHATGQEPSDLSKPPALSLRFASQTNDASGALSPPLSPQDYQKNKSTTITTMWTRVRSVDYITAAAVASKWPPSPSEASFPASPNINTSFLLPPTPSSPLTSTPGSSMDSYFHSLVSEHLGAVQKKE